MVYLIFDGKSAFFLSYICIFYYILFVIFYFHALFKYNFKFLDSFKVKCLKYIRFAMIS